MRRSRVGRCFTLLARRIGVFLASPTSARPCGL